MHRKCIAAHKETETSVSAYNNITKAIVKFLQMFMTETLAKRLVSMVLIHKVWFNTPSQTCLPQTCLRLYGDSDSDFKTKISVNFYRKRQF